MKMPEKVLLDQAANIIEKEGWAKRSFERYDYRTMKVTGRCMVGAILEASRRTGIPERDSCNLLSKYLFIKYGEPNIPSINDRMFTNSEQAVNALREAAK